MTASSDNANGRTLGAKELYTYLHPVPIFSSLEESDFGCLEGATLVQFDAGQKLSVREGFPPAYWIQLEGETVVYRLGADGRQQPIVTFGARETFGEVPLLGGSKENIEVIVGKPSIFVRLGEQDFWNLMVSCPKVRAGILGKLVQRQQGLQSIEMHREKMVALGTLSAGLMHELNNPGSAAQRAASQLRENLTRLQEITLKLTKESLNEAQLGCLVKLQQKTIHGQGACLKGSLEQADAEDDMATFLEGHGILEAWKIAPTLVAIGFTRHELECASHEFAGATLTDTLTWLEALVSSMQLVSTIEESISRVTELVRSVKKYAYEGKAERKVNVNESIYSAMVILGHKFREKAISVRKEFGPDLPPVQVSGPGLNQVWTNLLDNAIDAVAEQGTISVRTWLEAGGVCVSVVDNGSGIAAEHQEHIFDPFYTTKPVGVGTGLGLGIAQQIVQQMGGVIDFESQPGQTVFTVRLRASS